MMNVRRMVMTDLWVPTPPLSLLFLPSRCLEQKSFKAIVADDVSVAVETPSSHLHLENVRNAK